MKKRSTRDRIIRAATTLFQKQGYYASSTQDILDLAQAPRGCLYHHFRGGKSTLAAACVDSVVDDIIEQIRTLRLQGKTSRQVVEKFAQNIAQWLKKKKWREGMLLPTLTHEFASNDPQMAQHLKQAHEAIIAELMQMLQVEGMSEQAARLSAYRILTSWEGAASLARALQDLTPLIKAINWDSIITQE